MSTIQQLLQESSLDQVDKRVLLAYLCKKHLSWSKERLISHHQEELPSTLVLEWRHLEAMRIEGLPIAYLTQKKAFHDIDLFVNSAVLIPRPETELLVDLAIEFISKKLKQAGVTENSPLRILDLGTGSGAIILAIAHYFRNHSDKNKIQLIGSDISTEALEVAKKNAKHLSLPSIEWIESTWFDHLPTVSFDFILSNPPYISQDDSHLTQGDLRFEPQMALTDGEDGLEAYRQITKSSNSFLKLDGQILVEHGFNQGLAVHALFTQAGLTGVECKKDLNGLDRMTIAFKTNVPYTHKIR